MFYPFGLVRTQPFCLVNDCCLVNDLPPFYLVNVLPFSLGEYSTLRLVNTLTFLLGE